MDTGDSSAQGYYFGYSKHLKLAKISENELSKRSGVSKSTLNKIKSAQTPVSENLIRKVFNVLSANVTEQDIRATVLWDFDEEYSSQRQLNLDVTIGGISREIEGLTPVEFAILGLTNPKDWANSSDEQPFRIITSNDVYYYIPFIVEMLKYDGEEAEEVYGDNLENFLSITRSVFEARFKTDAPMIATGRQIGAVEDELLGLLGLGEDQEKIIEVNATLKSLCNRGLIVDPLIETVGLVGVSILGLVPTSFTKRTEDGDIVYRKISALLWEYEHLTEGEKEETKLHFRAQEIIEMLKSIVFNLNKNLNGDDKN